MTIGHAFTQTLLWHLEIFFQTPQWKNSTLPLKQDSTAYLRVYFSDSNSRAYWWGLVVAVAAGAAWHKNHLAKANEEKGILIQTKLTDAQGLAEDLKKGLKHGNFG